MAQLETVFSLREDFDKKQVREAVDACRSTLQKQLDQGTIATKASKKTQEEPQQGASAASSSVWKRAFNLIGGRSGSPSTKGYKKHAPPPVPAVGKSPESAATTASGSGPGVSAADPNDGNMPEIQTVDLSEFD
eukprot:GFYU01057586.1.p2 GENE.GFYU01057586.1~~GFYU01057586.1.p2  ORF type:complete len:134 (+),score=39.45 GFYU01057586.1:1-402(+)